MTSFCNISYSTPETVSISLSAAGAVLSAFSLATSDAFSDSGLAGADICELAGPDFLGLAGTEYWELADPDILGLAGLELLGLGGPELLDTSVELFLPVRSSSNPFVNGLALGDAPPSVDRPPSKDDVILPFFRSVELDMEDLSWATADRRVLEPLASKREPSSLPLVVRRADPFVVTLELRFASTTGRRTVPLPDCSPSSRTFNLS